MSRSIPLSCHSIKCNTIASSPSLLSSASIKHKECKQGVRATLTLFIGKSRMDLCHSLSSITAITRCPPCCRWLAHWLTLSHLNTSTKLLLLLGCISSVCLACISEDMHNSEPEHVAKGKFTFGLRYLIMDDDLNLIQSLHIRHWVQQ